MLLPHLEELRIERCPFRNLPDRTEGRCGEGMTAAKMANCRWLHPFIVARIEFLEWTPPYNKWSQTKRDKFEQSLAKIALDNTWFVVGASVQVKDYDEVVPQWLKDEDLHPYFFCFRLFLDAVLHLLNTQVDPVLTKKSKLYRKENEPVAFIFDQQQEFQDQALRTFTSLKAGARS